MGDLNWTEIIVAAFLFAGTLYGHWKTAQVSRDKTVQTVKDEMAGIREESQAKDEELHAELAMFKQETVSSLELIRKDIGALSQRVEKHNNVIERTYQLEKDTALQAEKIAALEKKVDS